MQAVGKVTQGKEGRCKSICNCQSEVLEITVVLRVGPWPGGQAAHFRASLCATDNARGSSLVCPQSLLPALYIRGKDAYAAKPD